MIGRTNTGGGGGSVGGSELTIVGGTTRPAKAAQNTIWVNTDAEITSYVISATQPSAPTEGMLWLSIADAGKVKMSAPVGKDWITVYPLRAKQYVSGAWVVVEAMSYQDGAWVEWITFYFKSGIGAIDAFEYVAEANGKCTIGTDKITLSQTNTSDLNLANAYTKEKKSFKAGDTVVFDAKCTWLSSTDVWKRRVGLYTAKNPVATHPTTNMVASAILTADSVRKEYTIPILSDGEYYVASCGVGDVEIYNIYKK